LINVLSTAYRRKVNDANFNRHKEGELHPDRVMGDHDIVFIQEGGWEIGQDGRSYLLEQGDVIFLHAGHHHYGVDGFLPGAKTMYLHIGAAPEDKLVQPANQGAAPEAALCLPIVVQSHGSMAAMSLIEDIILTFWSDSVNRDIRLAALVDLLLIELSSLGDDKSAGNDKLVEDALNRIRMTPNRIFTLAELAEMQHICSRSLTGRFKKITGKTVHTYQLELKLEMAYMLIKDNPGRPFKDVSRNLGFYDEFHFSKMFKRKYGFPPSELKKASHRNK
jgi:AraC-like DNA-binding protein